MTTITDNQIMNAECLQTLVAQMKCFVTTLAILMTLAAQLKDIVTTLAIIFSRSRMTNIYLS